MKPEQAEITDISDRKITLAYDGDLLISTGRSRFDTSWKNKTIRWSVLLSRLSRSKESGETHADFMRMNKEEQDRLKDIGGFVGGHLKGGHRKSGSVTARQILTLDADYAPTDFWKRLQDIVLDGIDGCAMAIYSTHKHSPSKPRQRMVICLR